MYAQYAQSHPLHSYYDFIAKTTNEPCSSYMERLCNNLSRAIGAVNMEQCDVEMYFGIHLVGERGR